VDQADSTARAASPAADDVIDKWYRALDRQELRLGTQAWPALVSGIHVQGRDLWIQISHAENPEQSLVLHVSRDTNIDAALAAAALVCAGILPGPRTIDLTTLPA